jgi:hypothetical protein
VSAYEEPPHEVAARHEGFVLRRYPALVAVETEVAGSFDDARTAAFRRLFRYISGANEAKQDVAMTVPVTSVPAQRAGREVAMTVPVTTAPAGAGGGYLMRFFLPREFTLATAPRPTDPAVRLAEVPERWLAVREWSGRATESNALEQQAALLTAVRAAGLVPQGTPEFAVYNGPFTLWFLRRNETWVRVEPPPAP